ncbi:tetratricopeptide repeat protein [Paenibacillus aurantius]|uniref:Tetratricopeptide repeat protein n=1 Tax=Paenibacillus aurantius TaxID=2918900 RepID=A0AA96LDB0_9BACL|nr:tetratricopeptide repeat protein [Paenibacillus aurantius]WNQ09617.1 tetratricopeptide repeat protein [Paenibacillus aurantius]
MITFLKRLLSSPKQVEKIKEVVVEPARTRDSEKMKVERNLKGSEYEKEGKIELAIELYEKNVEKGFDGSHPYDSLCDIYRKQKRINDEIRVLRKAIKVFEKISDLRSDKRPKLERYKERLKKVIELRDKR